MRKKDEDVLRLPTATLVKLRFLATEFGYDWKDVRVKLSDILAEHPNAYQGEIYRLAKEALEFSHAMSKLCSPNPEKQ